MKEKVDKSTSKETDFNPLVLGFLIVTIAILTGIGLFYSLVTSISC